MNSPQKDGPELSHLHRKQPWTTKAHTNSSLFPTDNPQIICPWSVPRIDIIQLTLLFDCPSKNRMWNPTCYHLPFSQVAVSSRRIKLCLLRRSQTPGHPRSTGSSPFPKPYRPHGQADTLGFSMECYLHYHLIPPHCWDQLRQGLNGHSLQGSKNSIAVNVRHCY